MQALPAEHHEAAMLPVDAEFDRLLRISVRAVHDGIDNLDDYAPRGEWQEIEEDVVLRVPCSKPAQSNVPSAEDLLRLAPYERALREVLDAQQLCFDAEALTKAFALLLKEVADMQGIRADKVDLSSDVLNALPKMWGMVTLLEVPEDLLLLQEEVRELHLNAHSLAEIPGWLGELVHLEVLCLDGTGGGQGDCNCFLTELPVALGNLHALKTLTLQYFGSLGALPVSIARLTSLETLHIKFCGTQELPAMRAMTRLTSLTLDSCELKELPCLEPLMALRHISLRSLPYLMRLPSSMGNLTGLRELRLYDCQRLTELPSIVRMASLETLYIYCPALQELPVMRAMTRLTSLTLQRCALKELPCLGLLTALRHLCLEYLPDLKRLPSSMDKLTGLRELRLVECSGITELPSIVRMLSLETLHIERCDALLELPASIDALTALHALVLKSLPKLKTLPASIGALTALTELTLKYCGLADVPSSIESLTALRTLTLDVTAGNSVFFDGHGSMALLDDKTFKTLACALPALRLLECLVLVGLCEDDVAAIGRSLKAWPLPLLDFDTSRWSNARHVQMGLKGCWKALGLPSEAYTAGWGNAEILEHWRVQQHKLAAFASGLHVRLGAASRVSSLNDAALVLIADEILGGWSLLKLW